MSTPSNKPTFDELVDGAPQLSPPTYKSLADFARVKPGSIGEFWIFASLKLVGGRR